jgi:hypothetical protein
MAAKAYVRCHSCMGCRTVPDDSKGPGHRRPCPTCKGTGKL